MVAPKVASFVAAGVTALAVRVLAGRRGGKGRAEVEDEELEDGEVGSAGVVPVTVAWDGIECELRDKRGKVVKRLLQSVSGEAKAGKLLAIMGPSGSGKTTLLNVLAGQLAVSPRIHLTGSLTINNRAVRAKSKRTRLAYVRQEDLFFSQLTVRETLSLAAELQLPKTWKAKVRERYVQELLYRLGLVSCADTIVGDAKARGISGGEKKRLSIACELIASPSVIFADEPTTGLDAFQAERVMETLRKLAQEGHTVVCSIHQPRGSIYSKFDDLVLLSNGAVVYAGPAQEHALAYFAELGHNCPEHTNPAEYFADLISVDYSSSENEAATRKKIAELVDAFASRRETRSLDALVSDARKLDSDDNEAQDAVAVTKAGFLWQFRLLLRRAWRQTTRDKATNRVRGAMSVSSALIFGSIFWRMGRSQTSVQDRMGLLQVAAINTAMAALTKTVNVFPKERSIVQREQAKGSYSLAPYLIAKLVAEAPVSAAFPLAFGAVVYPMTNLNPSIEKFLTFSGIVTAEAFAASAMGLTVGALAPTTEAALALGPSLMTVFIVFGGYYVNSENTPAIFRWIPRVSLIRWAFQALSINEFKGLKFEAKNSFDVQDGEQVLERLSFGGSSVKGAVNQELRIALFWYWLTYVLLKRNKAKFQVLEAPPPVAPVAPVSSRKLTIEDSVDE